MKENTNKSIAVNSLILYIRLAIISVSGLLYTRFSLQALGISDYGLYSVIACIITFISIINTIMVTTSNRFIAIAIGKNDQEEVCRQFNVNLVIHVLIALLTIAVALPLGHWYIVHHVTYDGDMHTVHTVFNVSIVAAALSFIGVPYNGLLDVSVVYHPGMTQLIEGFYLFVRGKFLNHRSVHPFRTRKVEVVEANKALVGIDGRLMKTPVGPFTVSVEQEVINFLIPE